MLKKDRRHSAIMKCSECDEMAVFKVPESDRVLCEDHAISHLSNPSNLPVLPRL